MRTKFVKNYPSEILTHDTMPSDRLLSLVYHNMQRKKVAWVPWKLRLTMAKSEDIMSQRAPKLPRLETATLHAILVDEPPSVEINNNGMGVNSVRNLLAVHDFALSMVGAAHLVNLKSYSAKFLQFLTQRVEPDSMLRCATIAEAQSADRQLWSIMRDITAERNWSLDDCLYEITHIRHDMPALLQLRPRPAKSPGPQMATHGYSSQGSKGRGKASMAQKGKGKGKQKGKVQWITEIKKSDSTAKQLCMQFQTGSCQRGDSCRFEHGCAYPVKGAACSLAHGASQHQAVPH